MECIGSGVTVPLVILSRASVPRVYALTADIAGTTPADVCKRLITGGIRWIQLRQKNVADALRFRHALQAREYVEESGMLFINDRADIALAVNAHGVHVGHTDLVPADIRYVAGSRTLAIGQSTHSLAEATEVAADPAVNYIAVGPIFPSRTKNVRAPLGLSVLEQLRPLTDKVLVAIGGIDAGNIRSVIDAGADSAAVIAALYDTPRIEANAARLIAALQE